MGRRIVKVSREGQVVIPVKIGWKFEIKREATFVNEGNRVTLIPVIPMEEVLGIDGDVMREIAREISEVRRRKPELMGPNK